MQQDSPPERYIPNRIENQQELCVLQDCLRRGVIKRPTIECDLDYYKTVTARLRRNIPNPPIVLAKEGEDESAGYICIGGMKVLEAIRLFIELGSKDPAVRPLSDYRTSVWVYPYLSRKKLQQFAKWYGDSPA